MHHIFNGKATIAAASFAGGISVGSFYIPARIVQKGIFLAGAIVSAVSISTGLIFTNIVIETLGLDPKDYDLVVAFLIGGSSLSIINMIANWLRKHEENTITEVVDEVREELKK